MSDPPPERSFQTKIKKEIRLVSAPSHLGLARNQLRGVPSTNVPLSVSVRRCGKKSKLGFKLPFVPLEQSDVPDDARCVLQVWELDRWNRSGKEDDAAAKTLAGNELLGEIEGFIKETVRKKKVRKFAFCTDQSPSNPPAQSDDNKGRIRLKISQTLAGGGVSSNEISWELNVKGELESRLEIGVTVRPKSKSLDFANKSFPYPVVYLHKTSEPPTEKEIEHIWVEKWKIWKKRKAANPGWKLDCGVATHHVLHILGGKREGTTLWHRTSSPGVWYNCTKQEGKDAKARFKKGFLDKIESDVVYAYSGKPGDDDEEPDYEEIELKPGMRIYSAEDCAEVSPGRWQWQDCHMTMYAGNDLILDSVGLSRPKPRALKNFYASPHRMFVVLRVLDPFEDMRSPAAVPLEPLPT